MIDFKACARLPHIRKIHKQEQNNRLPGVMRRVEEFEFQFNRSMYNLTLHREKNWLSDWKDVSREDDYDRCGHRLASAAHVARFV